MKDLIIKIRNSINRFLYKAIGKPILFAFDIEKVHNFMLVVGKFLGSNQLTRFFTRLIYSYSSKSLEQELLGLKFSNPIGLAAGFDKDAKLTKIIPEVGFGHMEIGSITGEPCEGNPERPRLWRLKKSKGYIIYYGLVNEGCEKIAKKLKNHKSKVPLGISIAKTNCKETVETRAGIKDYVKAFKTLKDHADYITINISCPNAHGGRSFTNPEDLEKLLTEIEKTFCEKPVLIKLPPDLSEKEIDEVIRVADNHRIAGFICTNLTKDRTNQEIKKHIKDAEPSAVGGISGKPIRDLSTQVIRQVYKKTTDPSRKNRYIIIGCGGVFSARDAYEKIKAGASLIQMITGMFFEGPQVISEINRGLTELLKKDGYKNISEAVGKAEKIKLSIGI